jgi:hypothetical protein
MPDPRSPARPLFVFVLIVISPPDRGSIRDDLVLSTRPLPDALPEGAPLDNVGTIGPLHPGTVFPTLSKTARPQNAL